MFENTFPIYVGLNTFWVILVTFWSLFRNISGRTDHCATCLVSRATFNYIHTYICVCTYIHMCMYILTYVYVHTYICVCTYLHMCMYIHTYVSMETETGLRLQFVIFKIVRKVFGQSFIQRFMYDRKVIKK
jgi:hypothetical protein